MSRISFVYNCLRNFHTKKSISTIELQCSSIKTKKQLIHILQQSRMLMCLCVCQQHHTLESVLRFRRGRSACNLHTRSLISFSFKYEAPQLFRLDMAQTSSCGALNSNFGLFCFRYVAGGSVTDKSCFKQGKMG